uniref:Uncharacterized protein n=1 Tax=Shewanella sp. (strain MR-7) TaxID=60481 RepID=Q0HVR5_SHESR
MDIRKKANNLGAAEEHEILESYSRLERFQNRHNKKPFSKNQDSYSVQHAKKSKKIRQTEQLTGLPTKPFLEVFSKFCDENKVTKRIHLVEFIVNFFSSPERSIQNFVVKSKNGLLQGSLPAWKSLPTVIRYTIYTLSFRHKTEHMFSFTLNFGRKLNSCITTDNPPEWTDRIAKRINYHIGNTTCKDFKLWFSIEHSEKEDIGYHLHGFIAWNDEEVETVRKALKAAVGEWETNKQCQLNFKVNWRHIQTAIKQSYYALKLPFGLYANHLVKSEARMYYETIRNGSKAKLSS